MIKLSDVKIRDYNFEDERSIINNASNMSEAKKVVEDYPEYDWTQVTDDIKHSEKVMKVSNTKNKEKFVYKTKGYKDKSLEYNDGLNKCDILVFNSPLVLNNMYSMYINNLTIAKMKTDLKYVLPDGSNYDLLRHKGIGTDKVEEFLKAIEFYEKQIERVAMTTGDRKINLFKYQYAAKKNIVAAYYKEIMYYLLDVHNEKLLWGDLSERARELYIESLYDDSARGQKVRNKIIEIITDYTTMKELDDLKLGNTKVLNRFIK